MRGILLGVLAMLLSAGMVAAAGFDNAGYNDQARIFRGTGMEWCMDKVGNQAWCESYLGAYANDIVMMKWNDEWDRGNDENWAHGPYDAWLSNQWNGKVNEGSGDVWHTKIKWVGPCGADYTELPDGGYCIWGQFEATLDHGTTADHEHSFWTHATPAGYGTTQ